MHTRETTTSHCIAHQYELQNNDLGAKKRPPARHSKTYKLYVSTRHRSIDSQKTNIVTEKKE